VPALLTEVPGRLPPALRPHAVLLAQQGQEDLGLVRAEPGQFAQPRQQLGTGLGARPHPGRVAAVPVHDHLAQLLHPAGHGPRIAVQRRPGAEDRRQRPGIERGQLRGRRLVAEPNHQVPRAGERLLDGHLLVEQHANEQRKRAGRQQLVGVGVDRQ
jgi:hypothetical protein